ncbi:MAG: hypothetical protein ABI679_13725 [Gemmatimonadota bacterium]
MRVALVLLGALVVSQSALAQDNLVTTRSIITGVQARGYSIDNGPKTRQVAFPIALVMPVNQRLSIDVGAYYASTRSEPFGDAATTVSGLTDTQVRGSYVFGRDAVVATLMLNLPTGKTQSLAQSSTTGAAAANFLSFPVNVYRTGFSATGGLAAATELGSWNVGIAGSLRMSGEYQPFSDDSARYSPGTEGRIKIGVDRTLGSSRLSAGFTFSTFGNDEFKNLGGGSGQYQPGNRYIGELAMAFLAGSGTVTGYVWDYYRNKAGGSGSAANKENIISIGANGSWPIGSNMRLEPLAEARFWSPEEGSGKMFGIGTSLQIPVGGKFTLSPAGRFDFGSTDFTDGVKHNLTGWGFSALLRYDL